MSLTRCAELFMAVPVVDLMAYQADPVRVAKIQVKGATHDLKVFHQYSLTPMIVSCVLDPLGAADVVLLTGEQAWSLPIDYVARGGAAGDHHPDNDDYHWRKRPALLSSMLREHLATPERWLELFNQTATLVSASLQVAGLLHDVATLRQGSMSIPSTDCEC